MKSILATIVAGACASCSIIPVPVPNGNGNGGGSIAVLMGGKGVLNYNADGSVAYSYSNEKSFQHAMQTAATLGTSFIGYLNNLAKEVTTRFQMGQITIQQRDAAMAAIEQAKIAAGITAGEQANEALKITTGQ